MQIIVFLAIVVLVNGQCDGISSCTECVAEGCGYCQIAPSSFCVARPQGDNPSAVNCDQAHSSDPETTPKFIISGPGCVGGCETQEDCESCSNVPGCSYCHEGDSLGCFSSNSNEIAQCVVATSGTCALECGLRKSCGACATEDEKNCRWCPNGEAGQTNALEGTCVTEANSNSTCWSKVSECPVPPKDAADKLMLSILPLLATIALVLNMS